MLSTRPLACLCIAACLLLLLAPGISWLTVSPSVLSSIQGVVIPGALLAGFLSLWGKHLWIGLLLLTPFAALAPVEAAFVVTYKHPLDHEILATVFESNLRETRDYLGAAFWPLLSSSLGGLVVAIAASMSAKRAPLVWRGRLRQYVLICTLLFPGALFTTLLSSLSGPLLARACSAATQMLGYRNVLEGGYPFGLPLHVFEYYTGWRQMRSDAEKLATFRFGAHATGKVDQKQIYVLVIGESSNRDHWSLFGYNRSTTPQLQAVRNLLPLTNMVSPWNASRKAIPVLLTRKPGTNTNDFFSEASIVRAYSESGFKTYWLSNQLAVGQHDSPISIYAHEADAVRFFNFANWIDRGTYDEVLLGALRNAIAESVGDAFIVLHTMGSHGRYEHRYPMEFNIFQPSVTEGNDLKTNEQVLNTYDNSISYTDHILAAIVDTLKSTKAITAMYYASDHGEDIPNEQCKLFGHGNNSRGNFFVPALLWYSDTYAQAFPDRVSRLNENHDQPVSTENVFESLIDLGGLDFPGHDTTKSIVSANFSRHQRFVNSFNLVDIDRSFFTKTCKFVVPKEEPGRTDPAQ